MTPADEGIAAAKADDLTKCDGLAELALAELNARKIKRRAASILTDVKQYRDPALLDPSDLDEIGKGLERLRKIAGEAIGAREAEEGAEEEPDPWIDMPGAAEGMRLTEKGLADVRSLNEQQTQETDGPMERLGRLEQAVKGVGERLEQIDESAKPEPFPAEGAATGGYVAGPGSMGPRHRSVGGSRFWPRGRPVCQFIVESLRDLAEWPDALLDERLEELSNVLIGASESDGGGRAAGVLNAFRTIVLVEIEDRRRGSTTSPPDAAPEAEPPVEKPRPPLDLKQLKDLGALEREPTADPVAEARSLCPDGEAAGISTDIEEPKADLDLVDTGGGKALGFEMSLPGLEVAVLITDAEGEGLPAERENLAALYIDGDERARLTGNFEKVTRWARVIKRELEELQERDLLRHVSWSKFARAFDGVLR